jgi:galactokinase
VIGYGQAVMNYAELVENEFRKLYNEQPIIVRSPGRVNLIGEHTDYNEGYVLPAAIDKAIVFAIAPREDQRCSICALDLKDVCDLDLGRLGPSAKGWPNYLTGIVDQMIRGGYELRGFNCVFGGDIPIGAGLSSSAALETGLAYALNILFELNIDKLSLVKLAQKSENEFVGVRCGIMDQFANMFGQRNRVLRLDCRSLESRSYPFDFSNVSIVLFDTGVSHSLASTEYNRRREECAEGVRVIGSRFANVNHLRDVTDRMLKESGERMDVVIYRRCKYVVEENERVLRACVALENNDLAGFGSLMYATHEGLRREYEVSCAELDFLVEAVMPIPHVYGARMMGGGFGGCTINLIETKEIEGISAEVAEKYKRRFQIDLKTYVTEISSGTRVVHTEEEVVPEKRARFRVAR